SGAFEFTLLKINSVTSQPPGTPVGVLGLATSQTNGGSVTFTVNAAGLAPLHYDWFFAGAGTRGTNQGVNSPNFVIPKATPTNQGNYRVIVADATGARATSGVITLTIIANPAVITVPPSNQTVHVGEPVHFSV